MKNWKTSAGAIIALIVAGAQAFGIDIPGVSEHTGNIAALLALAFSLTQAKDKDVTGAGSSATRVK